MRSKKIIRLFTAMLAVALCTTAFSVPVSAGGGDGEPYYTETAEPEVTEEPQEEATGGMEPEGQPLTPEGNATLVDDFYGDKQLITVTTKAGNYFYILIDRANEDAETAVHFLNQVDEADLLALMEDGEVQETPAVCRSLSVVTSRSPYFFPFYPASWPDLPSGFWAGAARIFRGQVQTAGVLRGIQHRTGNTHGSLPLQMRSRR